MKPPIPVMNILIETDNQFNDNNRGLEYSSDFLFSFTQNTLCKYISHSVPYVLEDSTTARYILLTELEDDLNRWVRTGKTEMLKFRVLPDNKEKMLSAMCRNLKLTVTRGSQMLQYCGRTAEIEYLRVKDSNAKTSVALIPWFMIPRKKYPVFVYLFTYWYCQLLHKSEREAAMAAATLFGTEIHYSVISRSANMARALLDIKDPLPRTKPAAVSFDDILNAVPVLLKTAIDQVQLPPGCYPAAALTNIPLCCANIIRLEVRRPANATPPVTTRRKKTPDDCPADKPSKKKPKYIQLVSDRKINKIRRVFIALCQRLVVNATKLYHRFLI